MFSFFDTRTPAQRFADEAMEHISALARQIGQAGQVGTDAISHAPDHLKSMAKSLDRMGIGPGVAAAAGQHALRSVSRNPSLLAPLVVVGAAVAIGYWLAQPSQQPAAPHVKRSRD
jgi:orotidine-5'-phosphate decarboxylase